MSSLRNQRTLVTRDNESVVSCLLERLVSILLRLGLDSPRAEALIRNAFILEATKRARLTGTRSTQSQIALLAGVNRLDVRRILASQNQPRPSKPSSRRSRVERILLAWSQDPAFATKPGHARPLKFIGPNSQFERLVRKYGRDISARTLREDLIKNKLVVQDGGRLVLARRGKPKDKLSNAALADLAFLNSQLARFDFSHGRRDYVERSLCLSASDSTLLKLAQRKATAKIDTALSSLEPIQRSLAVPSTGRGRRAHRLVITAIISAEFDSSDA
jgi:uncharacterized protein DUF6502